MEAAALGSSDIVKTEFEGRFWCFHTSVLIFTDKDHESFYILFLCCLCSVLHSADLGFGFAQRFYVV